jgi:hypothetical protein
MNNTIQMCASSFQRPVPLIRNSSFRDSKGQRSLGMHRGYARNGGQGQVSSRQKKNQVVPSPRPDVAVISTDLGLCPSTETANNMNSRPLITAQKLDRVCMILYAVLFFLFVIVYCIYFMVI